jgi:hypothetical protein
VQVYRVKGMTSRESRVPGRQSDPTAKMRNVKSGWE